MHRPAVCVRGFTLVALAVVLLVVSLIFGGVSLSLSRTRDIHHFRKTQAQLTEIKGALLGFAAATGRLPCPASATSNGQESLCLAESGTCDAVASPPTEATSHGRCSNPYDGFLPGMTLGLPGLDTNGFALDSWGSRFRYAIADANVEPLQHLFTRADGMKSATMAAIFNKTLLSICSSATSLNGTTCGAATLLSNSAVAVIFSPGRNAVSGGIGADESANLDGDAFFVSHTQTSADSPGGEFDDLVTWIGTSVLFNRMIAAGKLP